MKGPGGRRRDDEAWKHFAKLDGNRVRCLRCKLEFSTNSSTRLKEHLYPHLYKNRTNVRRCDQFSQAADGSTERDKSNVGSKGATLQCQAGKLPRETTVQRISSLTGEQVDERHKGAMLQCQPFGPFSVSQNKYDERDLLLIQYAFDGSRDPGEVIVRFPRYFLRRNDFKSLKPKALLDSSVIDAFAENFTKNAVTRNWYLPLLFSDAVSNNASSFLEFVNNNSKKDFLPSDLGACDKMFIPTHIGPQLGGHYYLNVIDLKQKIIKIWDSKPSFSTEAIRRQRASELLFALDKLFSNHKSKCWEFKDFSVEMETNAPTQPAEDGYDCGMFVIKFMKHLADGMNNKPFEFESDQERLDLALDLLKSEQNQTREQLFKACQPAKEYPQKTDASLFTSNEIVNHHHQGPITDNNILEPDPKFQPYNSGNSHQHQTASMDMDDRISDMLTEQVDERHKGAMLQCQPFGPFSVSQNKYDERDLSLIQYAFDGSRDAREVIVGFPRCFLTRNEFKSLKPKALLDSWVIDAFAENFTKIEEEKMKNAVTRNWCLPLSFSDAVSNNASLFLEFVNNNLKKDFLPSDLGDCDKMFIPTHIGPRLGGHYYLNVIDLKQKIIKIWDSKPSFSTEAIRRQRASELLLALDKLFPNHESKCWEFKDFSVEMETNAPTQPDEDGYDCGMFVIKFIKHLADGMNNKPFEFESDQERLDLALELLKSEQNQTRQQLFKACQPAKDYPQKTDASLFPSNEIVNHHHQGPITDSNILEPDPKFQPYNSGNSHQHQTASMDMDDSISYMLTELVEIRLDEALGSNKTGPMIDNNNNLEPNPSLQPSNSGNFHQPQTTLMDVNDIQTQMQSYNNIGIGKQLDGLDNMQTDAVTNPCHSNQVVMQNHQGPITDSNNLEQHPTCTSAWWTLVSGTGALPQDSGNMQISDDETQLSIDLILISIEEKMKRLKCRKDDVETDLLHLEKMTGKKRKREVEHWLKEVEMTINKILEVKKRLMSEKDSFERSLLNLQLKTLEAEVERLSVQTLPLSLTLEERTPRNHAFPCDDLVGEEFFNMVDDILKILSANEAVIVGVYGMGGAGKTSLVKHIYNQTIEKQVDTFSHAIWVKVPQNFTILKLQKVVARRIGINLSDNNDTEIRAAELLSGMESKRKCVIILDDVWKDFDLSLIGISSKVSGINVIITSRSRDVCARLVSSEDHMIKVKPLSGKEARVLFWHYSGHHALSASAEFLEIAESIINECAGLPLAIKLMGSATRGFKTIEEWRHMLKQLKNSNVGENDKGRELLGKLRVSYDNLKNEKLRKCFLHCALYPEDKEYDEGLLILGFVDGGLIDGRQSYQEQADEGVTILNKLVSMCLLEYDIFLKMHDLIRDMAIDIMESTGGYLVKAGIGLTEVPDEQDWKENLRVVSLMDNNIEEIPSMEPPRCPNLSHLFLNHNRSLELIPDDFFINMPALTILDLSYTNIQRLPKSVSDSEGLVSLLLRNCYNLEFMPSLEKLQQLTRLDMRGTKIIQLPPGFEKLIKLRWIDLSCTGHLSMTTSMVSNLTNLQFLLLDHSVDVKARDLTRLKQLQIFGGFFYDVDEFKAFVGMITQKKNCQLSCYSICLMGVGDREFVSEIYSGWLERFPLNGRQIVLLGIEAQLQLPGDVTELWVEECNKWRCLCEALSFYKKKENEKRYSELKKYYISKCQNLEYLFCSSPSCDLCFSVQNITELHLFRLDNLSGLCNENDEDRVIEASSVYHPCPAFSSLGMLRIYNCDGMVKLFTPKTTKHLKCLEMIYVSSCHSMKEVFSVSTDKGEEGSERRTTIHHLPRLHRMELLNLPKMKIICKGVVAFEQPLEFLTSEFLEPSQFFFIGRASRVGGKKIC